MNPRKPFLPYSSLPNTRPKISSPLTVELKRDSPSPDRKQQPHSQEQSRPSPRCLLLFLLIDSLIFIQLAHRILTPYLLPHLTQSIVHLFSLPFIELPLPAELVVPTLTLLKALSAICLLHTGSTILSYSSHSLLVYTPIAALVYIANLYPSLSSSLLLCIVCLLVVSLVICLPLLRLTQVLLDLEDQQALEAGHNRHLHYSNSGGKPATLVRKHDHSSRHSNRLAPQARYQHLMNPF
ncbi:hypothetical protein PCANC_21998 [Puccinia coronata f. sp. avenae]|uniref:Uncharacterized protein n=1 Tax=Puccinia coronata f. sp. avenae TaxID=200324 RepID=A0A2N5SFE5_9BASI|nr:hypothetical protein PCANC_21998 [Puccinia coronata f. sp. avenae]